MFNPEIVNATINQVNLAACALASAKLHEDELEDSRQAVKSEAIARIMELPDPQKEGKQYSATAAEKLVDTDKVYSLHRLDQRSAAAATIRAAGVFETAKLRAQLAIAEANLAQYGVLRTMLDQTHALATTIGAGR